MKRAIVLLFLMIFLTASAVNASHGDGLKCKNSKIKAQAAIKKGELNFFIQGGIVATYVKGQEVFEQKYKLKYFDFGCVVPNDICIADYNATIAKYLDQRFGKGWRKEVRKDIRGI